MKKFLAILVFLVMLLSIMSALFLTTYAATNISSVAVTGIDTPLPGKALDLNGVVNSEGYALYSQNPISWFDLSSGNSLKSIPQDSKFIEGHQYSVMIKLRTNAGYEFATKNNSSIVKAAINSQPADVTVYGNESPKNFIAISYTFPVCKKNIISSIDVKSNKDIAKGTELTSDLLKVTTTGTTGVLPAWTHNGVGVNYGTKVEHGHYGALLTFVADTGYCFNQSTFTKINGIDKKLYPYWLSSSGTVLMVQTGEDFFDIPCEHENDASVISNEWKSDVTTHWHECNICGEKSSIEAHNFNDPIEENGKTTYTCTQCGYKKIVSGNKDGFIYSECNGGMQIVAYNGNATNVEIPSTLEEKNVVSIGDYALCKYNNKVNIESISIPSTVTSIGRGAFDGCLNLQNVNIPSGVKRIEIETFLGCSSLAILNIPHGITYIGANAFQGCTSLNNFVIPCGVEEIGNDAFRSCTSLTEIVIPDSVKKLGTLTFGACTGLKNVVIGNGISSIPQSMFEGCTSLETITLPATLNYIDKYAFDKTIVTKVNYSGSEEQWKNITIQNNTSYNKPIVDAEKNYNYSVKKDIGQHTYKPVTVVKPTCIDKGYTLYVCEGCGDSYQTDFVNETGVHTYNSGVITKEPTCVEKGEKTYTCNVCGHSYTEEVKALGHDYKTTITKATLSKNGEIITKCTKCGDIKSKTQIDYPKTISLSKTSFTYNKKIQKPTIIIKDSKGKIISASNYTLKYSNKNSKKVGEYTVTITFKGNYSGTKTFKYTINPKGTSLKKLTKGSKQFKVTWKAQKTETAGYELQYSTNSNFKSGNKKVNIKKNKTTSTTVKKLKKKKKYYVRIRTYKTVNGKKVYSSWSSTKNIKTK